MKRTYFRYPALLSIAILFSAYSQAQDVFQKSYDHFYTDRANTLEVLPNGNIVLAGATALQGNSQQQMMLTMLDKTGKPIWVKTYAETGFRTEATDIFRSPDGNLIVTYDAFNSSGEAKASWMKISPADGSIKWNKRAIQSCRILKISALKDGYLLGGDYVISPTDRDALALKINENGDVQWYKVFGEPGYEQLGQCWQDDAGFIHCSGYHIEINESQGIYVRFNAAGDMPGPVKKYSIGDNTDLLSRIAPLSGGGFIMAGNSQGFNDNFARAWTLTTDADGNLRTSYTFKITGKHIGVTDMSAVSNDQFVLSLGRPAPSGTPAILLKINELQNMLWVNTYKGDGKDNILWQVKPDDGGFAACGASTNNGQTNLFLAKTDENGIAGDCCPQSSGLQREEVHPEQSSLVPNITTGFNVQNVISTPTEASVIPNTLCLPINVDFELADSTLCPNECTQLTLSDGLPDIDYTLNITGGELDPATTGKLCHKDSSVIVVTRKGTFNGCSVEKSKTVTIGAKEDHFPNAFTPNGDGANDFFRPVFPCEIISAHLKIFSRWGELLFETDDVKTGWDGRIGNAEASSDVYAWVVEYEAIRAGQRVRLTKFGDVSLLR